MPLSDRPPRKKRTPAAGRCFPAPVTTSNEADLTGARVEARFARLFLKLADQIGRPEHGGEFVQMPLSRQELADLTGTTIETAIRLMSRWEKEDVLHTQKDGFVVRDRQALEDAAS